MDARDAYAEWAADCRRIIVPCIAFERALPYIPFAPDKHPLEPLHVPTIPAIAKRVPATARLCLSSIIPKSNGVALLPLVLPPRFPAPMPSLISNRIVIEPRNAICTAPIPAHQGPLPLMPISAPVCWRKCNRSRRITKRRHVANRAVDSSLRRTTVSDPSSCEAISQQSCALRITANRRILEHYALLEALECGTLAISVTIDEDDFCPSCCALSVNGETLCLAFAPEHTCKCANVLLLRNTDIKSTVEQILRHVLTAKDANE